ncbi:MAG: phage holin family protein [Verrucomicrobiales bacterium]
MNPESAQPTPPRHSLPDDLGAYLRLRSELFLIESKEAASLLGRRAAFLLIALFCALAGYVLLVATAILLLGRWFASLGEHALAGAGGAALLIAILHLLAAAGLFIACRKKPSPQLYEFTKSEWEKDRQWLSNGKEKQH